jgi:hypothetical protein
MGVWGEVLDVVGDSEARDLLLFMQPVPFRAAMEKMVDDTIDSFLAREKAGDIFWLAGEEGE